ncbi:extracellular solute-binding protein [Demequina sp. SYSU T00039]|uniref:Extracellular solute-binding protein n=1 Tax=Demequina lignilytica TaxID=3051663 RepID=A0AAW7M542_9MICO|nr:MULTISPECIES: extracellular solute-binding protein [unclassified Demequina]MDN4479155.1 extracellular solute-binding protein [Demequina sp. SYSU T00039-1]MDN4489132.1 extracellular solute-binding protein [Demequina sp. SYSU T00039]
MPFSHRRAAYGLPALIAVSALSLAACSSGSSSPDSSSSGETTDAMEPVELSFLVDNTETSVGVVNALTAAYTAEHPNVTFAVEERPGGGDGDNIVKTRLQTGEMSDLFFYNSGSLFQALAPTRTLLPIDDLPNAGAIQDTFKAGVTADGSLYGVPAGTAMGGGVMYNIPMYEELGLEVPTSWDEFMDNNQAILDAGKVPVIQTFADTWTSQLFVLGDFANVLKADPEWADKYTANEAKYADGSPAIDGFVHQQEVYEAGYLNEDFASATFADGVRMVAQGEGAHYPMLTFALAEVIANSPDNVDDVGFFALPGASTDSPLTTWLGAGIYAPNTTEHADVVKDFMNFVATPEACDIQTEAVGAQGPYFVDGCTLPDDVPQMVADMLPYFDANNTGPALEFVSPIKGPALEQITVEVGSGIRTAEDGAALYDQDVEKQAQQLGLEGW